jgi:hypothetical protein
MRLMVAVITLALLLGVQAIVDRTYFNYLGRLELSQDSR